MNYKQLYYFTGRCLGMESDAGFRQQFIDLTGEASFPWEACLQLWSNELVIPAIYLQLKHQQLLDHLPKGMSQVLATFYLLNCQRNASIVDQVQKICTTLTAHHIEPLLLKGAGNLLDNLYEDLGERMIHDIDLLVHEADFLPTVMIVQSLGYSYRSTPYLDYSTLKHFAPLYNKDEPAVVEIHRLPVPAPWAEHFSPSLLFSQRRAVACSPGLYVPCDAHKLLHTFIHSQLVDRGHAYHQASFRGFGDLYRLSQRMDVTSLVADTPHPAKAVAWMAFAQEVLGMPRRFYPLKAKDARWYTWKYKLSLSHTWLYWGYTFTRKLAELIFERYLAGLWRTLFQQSERVSMYHRLRSAQWYKAHLLSYRDHFLG